jgi:hypothetical protein
VRFKADCENSAFTFVFMTAMLDFSFRRLELAYLLRAYAPFAYTEPSNHRARLKYCFKSVT